MPIKQELTQQYVFSVFLHGQPKYPQNENIDIHTRPVSGRHEKALQHRILPDGQPDCRIIGRRRVRSVRVMLRILFREKKEQTLYAYGKKRKADGFTHPNERYSKSRKIRFSLAEENPARTTDTAQIQPEHRLLPIYNKGDKS